MARRQKNIARSTRFAPTFESLEPRQLLAANVLANGFLDNINLNNAGDTHKLQFEVNSQEPLVFAFDMVGQEGLNPGNISIESFSGHTIAPIASSNGTTTSTFLAELGPGSYEITVLADGGTTGSYDFSVSLVGDLDGDAQVSDFEQMWLEAAIAQGNGTMNGFTASYYSSLGIPVNQNLYDLDIDANRDGNIDGYDYASIISNIGNGNFTIELTNDAEAPVIFADLANDTGYSDTDGITTDITITGNVTDAADSTIVTFQASVDLGDSVDILGKVDANGNFTLSQAELETIADGSLDDGAEHVLSLIASDEYGNVSQQAYTVNFTLDIIAPDAPVTPDMIDASDLGYSNTDNLTADNTPTFTIIAEAGATVELYSDVAGLIGQGTADANGEVTITPATLADGDHAITAKAIDAAGNESVVSAVLNITIDTTLPAAPVHDLAAASDTGDQGDQLTSETTVTIEGTTDPNTQVEMVGTTMETVSDASGNFSFSGVALAFGENAITVRATSESGAINESATTYIQNNAPTSVAIDPVTIGENDGTILVADLSDIFDDVNLADGDALTYQCTSALPDWLTDITIQDGNLYVTTEGELYGSSTIEITATDIYGETVSGTVDLTVAPENDLPGYSELSPTVTGVKDEPVVVDDISDYFADEETSSSNLAITVASATHGTATITNGELTFAPDAGYHGEATIYLDVTDTAFESIPANTVQLSLTVNINNQNHPVVVNDVAADATDEDNTQNILIDSSVTSDAETALANLEIEIINATDNGDGTYTITGGTVQIVEESGNRYFRFTPDENWNGTTSFDYQVTDEPQDPDPATSNTATVTITVDPVNDAPVADDDERTINEDADPVEIPVADLVSDVETDLADLVSSISFSNVAGGTVEVVEIAGVPTFQFTPTENYHGDAGFTYTVTDTGEPSLVDVKTDSGTVDITINAVNDIPEANGAEKNTTEDQSFDVDLRDLVEDLETDDAALTFSVGNAVNGTVQLISGHIARFTPSENYNDNRVGSLGGASFTYTVTDTADDDADPVTVGPITITVTEVTPVNDAPVAVDDEWQVPNDQDTVLDVLANDDDPDNGDGETDTLIITAADVNEENKGSVTFTDSEITYTPEPGVTEEYDVTISYTIEDGSNETATAEVLLHVVPNVAPVAIDDGFDVDENGTVSGNLLDNDTDSDGDPLTIIDHDARDFLTVNADGSFTYDLSETDLYESLAADGTASETFTYKISDGQGGEDTATVTITINGVNTAPVGVGDSDETDDATSITIDVLANDTDVDSPHSALEIASSGLQVISNLGASVSITPDGRLYYDPTNSTTLTALAVNQSRTDTFTYRLTDGSALSDPVTVTVEVNGTGNNAPQVDNPIADITITLNDGENQPDQPELIDLTNVFSDIDGHNLSFSAISSNTDIVTVEIVNGTHLKVEYLDYNVDQDRTPAMITVAATETDSGEGKSVTNDFTVTVNPIQPVELHLVVRNTATEYTTAFQTEALPTSIDTVTVGDSYVVELWAINTYYTTDSTTGGGLDISLATVSGDLGFNANGSLSLATDMGFAGAYISGAGGDIDNPNNVVNDFGGATTVDDVGVNPYYSRIGYVVFNATAAGTQEFTFTPELVTMLSIGDEMDLSQVDVTGATVEQENEENTYTFTLDNSAIDVSGTIGNQTIQPTYSDALTTNVTSISGSMNVKFDNYDNPSNLTITSGILDPGLYEGNTGSSLAPAVGGAAGSDEANFGFVTDDYQMAIRNLSFTFESPSIEIQGSSFINTADIITTCSGGFIDYRSANGADSGRIVLTDLDSSKITIEPDLNGSVTDLGTVRQIRYVCEYTVDLSEYFGEGSEVTFDLQIFVIHDTAAPIMGTTTVEDTPTDVAMSIVKTPTETDANGEIADMPPSEAWLDEWDSYWVEVWVNTEEGSGVSTANVDLTYNADYFTATEIEYSPAVISDFSGDILTDGIVSGLGGTFNADLGVNGRVLLGRVKFESLADDGIELDVESFGTKPLDLGLELTVNALTVEGVDQATVGIDRVPTTELWAMPYDINDDDVIDLYDCSKLLTQFRADVTESNSAMSQVVDFNNDGTVNLLDFSCLLANFKVTKESGQDINLPDTFTQRWVGSGLDITGDSSAGELLDAATTMWQTLLGTDDPIDIQLVVTDFGDSMQLASAEILATDENGMPIAGRVTLDDDAAGLGWYSQIDGLPDETMYDLYTVMLHEIGHTLGFISSYEGFADQLEVIDGQVTFVSEDLSVAMDNAGNHVAGDDLSGDVMSSTLDPGVRKLPSELDAQMILAAYEAAADGASGFTTTSAAIMAAETAEAVAIATTDFNRIEGTLVGDMTWDRLFKTHSEKPESSHETADDLAVDILFAYESNKTSEIVIRKDSGFESESNVEPFVDFAEMFAEEETIDETVDNIFENWDELL